MQRQNSSAQRSDSILLYGFGLALTLSLAFNGFLLHEQSRHQNILYEYGLGTGHPADVIVWQQQLSDCARSNEEKDSVIYQLEHVSTVLPGQPSIVQRTNSE